MSLNIMDAIQSLFNNDFAGKAASYLGESETSVKNALSGISPSVLTGLLHKAGTSDPQGLLDLVKDASRSMTGENLSGMFNNTGMQTRGSDMLKGLFGANMANLSGLISKFSGIQPSSADSLMNMATPAVLGVVGKHAIDTKMSAGSFLSFLNSQKHHIMNAVPSGLNLASILGLGSLTGIGSQLLGKVSEYSGNVSHGISKAIHTEEKKTDSGRRWLPWILGTLAILILIALLSRGCNGLDKTSSVSPIDTVAKAIDSVIAQPVVAAVRESFKVKLPDGVELNAYKGGIEDQLVMFLNDPATVAGKNIWFDFDNLNFNTGSAEITQESMAQVKNISAILKAYPKLKIKIGGYTDKTGDEHSNLKLSRSRANAVAAALKAEGSNMGQVTGAEGYGSKFAKAAADAPDDERQKDRRIAIGVRAK